MGGQRRRWAFFSNLLECEGFESEAYLDRAIHLGQLFLRKIANASSETALVYSVEVASVPGGLTPRNVLDMFWNGTLKPALFTNSFANNRGNDQIPTANDQIRRGPTKGSKTARWARIPPLVIGHSIRRSDRGFQE
jgi:hypothetical protein